MNKWLAISLLAFVLAGTASAQAKITVDPNAPARVEQATQEISIFNADARLAQKVTYSAPRKMVSEILADLTEQTGVTFKAGYNSQDWQVRDRRMNIFARDLPLKDLMQSIQRVMKFKWSRGGEAPNYTYRLYMDRRTLLDAETKRLREDEQRRQHQVKSRLDLMSKYSKIADLSPEEMAKLKQSDPFSYVLGKAGVTKGLGAFFDDVPAAAEALANGSELILSGANISEAGRQGLLASVDAANKFEKMIGGHESTRSREVTDPSQLSVSINESLDVSDRMAGNFILGMIMIKNGDRHLMGIPLIKPESSIARMLGNILIRADEEHKSMSDLMKESQDAFTQALMSDMKSAEFGEAAADHSNDSADPTLEKKIKLQYEKTFIADIEQALAKAGELSVVSDAFDRASMDPRLKDKDMAVREAVEQIAGTCLFNWAKNGSVIEFRDRDWYRKRMEQIPQAWIDGWAETLKTTGTLDLPDLIQIAALSQEQISRNLSEDPFMSSNVMSFYWQGKDVLRAYGSLTGSQQAMAGSDAGLDLGTLTPEQWAGFSRLISRKNNSLLQDVQARFTFTAAKRIEDNQGFWKCTIRASGYEKPLEWDITLPRYVEPKKPEPKPQPAVDPDAPKQEQAK